MIDKNKFLKQNQSLLNKLKDFKRLQDIPSKFRKDKTVARLRIDIGLMKLPKIVQEVEEQLNKNNPVVLFVIHKEVLAAYKNHFGTDAYYLSGETSNKNREIARKGFEAGKKKLIILSIGAGKEGLTLIKSSYMVIGEIDWEAVPMLQAMDRIHRVGQTKDCIIKVPFIPNTIDEYILGLVKEKLKVSSILL